MRLRELFDAVADLPEAEQESALRRLTQDAALLDQVLRLLGHARDTTTRFSAAVENNATLLASQLSEEMAAGDVLGNWRLIEKIGQGGMGSVFRAERADGVFEQQVAIKVIHGLPTESAKSRLAQERQILAGLTHPNIARLFDGGSTPSGQPYLVMELITGEPLDTYCRQKKASFLEVLALLHPICETVAVAHQRLIVHCDIKPANILVTASGRPVLLDFGIASLLGQGGDPVAAHAAETMGSSRGSGDTLDKLTRTIILSSGAAVAYTPRYASPEQRAGQPVTTASDIFSLGRVLEELCLQDPVFASQSGSASLLGPHGLRMRETCAIIYRACSELPLLRYRSVANMAEDIQRVLKGELVVAAADIPNYRLRKWVGKNAVALAAGASFLALSGGFSWQLYAQKQLAQQQATAAGLERDKASAAKREAEAASQAALAARAQAESARAQAEAAQRDTLAAKTEAEKQRDAAIASDKRAQIAKEQAEELEGLEKVAKNRALEAEKAALADRDRVVEAQKSAARVNDFLVSMFDGVNPEKGGNRNASARDVIAQAESRLNELKDIDPQAQANLFESLSRLHLNLGEAVKAIEYQERRIKVLEAVGERSINTRVNALNQIAVLRRNGNLPGARQAAERAVLLATPRAEKHPLTYAVALDGLAQVLQTELRITKARDLYHTQEALWHKSGKEPWSDNAYRAFRHNKAYNEYYSGNYRTAAAEFRKVIEARLADKNISDRRVSLSQSGLAKTLERMGELGEAESLHKAAIARLEASVGDGASSQRTAIQDYATFLRRQNRFAEARAQLNRAQSLVKSADPASPEGRGLLIAWAELASAEGRHHEALRLRTIVAASDEAEPQAVLNRYELVRLRYRLGEYAAARAALIGFFEQIKSDFEVTEQRWLAAERLLADIEGAEKNILQAANRLNSVVANSLNVTPLFQQSSHYLAARAWRKVFVARKSGAGLGTVDSVDSMPLLPTTGSPVPAEVAVVYPPTITAQQALNIARAHAKMAVELARGTGGVNSSIYQEALAVQASLDKERGDTTLTEVRR